MKRFAFAGALTLVLLFAAHASAATRYVDDDGRQCSQARHATIQSAINASAARDVVRVCAGRYAEQLTLPAGKPGLFVASLPARAARVVAPAGGLASHPFADFRGRRMDLVLLQGARQHFDGFRVEGPLTHRQPQDECFPTAALGVEGDGAAVNGNVLTALGDNPCSADETVDVGVHASGPGAVVDRNTVSGAAVGIVLASGVAQRNIVVGRGAGEDEPTWGIFFGSLDGSLSGSGGTVRSNDVSAAGTGVALGYNGGLVVGNHVHDNGRGVVLEDGSGGEISRNFVRRNSGDGIVAPELGNHTLGRRGLISSNQVRDNGHDGIALYGCTFGDCEGIPSHSAFRVERNSSLGNARYDCFDDGLGANTWNANVGLTDLPNVCSKPY